MTEKNVFEISLHPEFANDSLHGELQDSPEVEEIVRDFMAFTTSLANDLIEVAVFPDCKVTIVLDDYPKSPIQTTMGWKLTESVRSSASIHDIFYGISTKSYDFIEGYLLTELGEILEYEKSIDDNDMNLIHTSGRHGATHIKHGRVYHSAKIIPSLMDSLDLLGSKTIID